LIEVEENLLSGIEDMIVKHISSMTKANYLKYAPVDFGPYPASLPEI
jgi:hypothetical protein